jgi:hypothetical protein
MLKSLLGIVTSVLLTIFASAAGAAPTAYVFDTVTRFDFGSPQNAGQNSITGILRNDTTPTTVTFRDTSLARCVPVLLTMIEKPGRYYLNITIDPQLVNLGMPSCGLELRS